MQTLPLLAYRRYSVGVGNLEHASEIAGAFQVEGVREATRVPRWPLDFNFLSATDRLEVAFVFVAKFRFVATFVAPGAVPEAGETKGEESPMSP